MINIDNYDIFGLRMPDAIAGWSFNDTNFYISANEGDSRDSDESRGADLVDGDLSNGEIDTSEVSAELQAQLADDALLGRLTFSNIDGDTDGDGLIEELYSFGGRSFTIYQDGVGPIWDSGNLIEVVIANEVHEIFNANEGDPSNFDNRSDNKGPEPEGVAVGVVDGVTYGFIGLERVGGVIVMDLSDPTSPVYDHYIQI